MKRKAQVEVEMSSVKEEENIHKYAKLKAELVKIVGEIERIETGATV